MVGGSSLLCSNTHVVGNQATGVQTSPSDAPLHPPWAGEVMMGVEKGTAVRMEVRTLVYSLLP